MPSKKVILLACGSFNPPTNMHLRMFEIARDHLHRLGNHTVIGGLMSPVHNQYGKKELVSSTHRVEMLKMALQTSDWIKVSDWECKQETWSRTKATLQHHQNQINSYLHGSINDFNEDDALWLPDLLKNGCNGPIQVKLLCGADLLESFAVPGLWADEDIEAIVKNHGLVVITRQNSNPLEFIYNSDLLTKYMANIFIVTEWIQNDISSTKIRRALRRSESVKYLIPDKVVDYIHKHCLYGSEHTKYLIPKDSLYNSVFLTPSPSDPLDSSSPPTNNCMMLCNNNIFSSNRKTLNDDNSMSIDCVDSITKTKISNKRNHPGQAVKIITESSGEHVVLNKTNCSSSRKVCNDLDCKNELKTSKSCTNFETLNKQSSIKGCKSNRDLKDCDENSIKFIFTKHGIQVISDVETIV